MDQTVQQSALVTPAAERRERIAQSGERISAFVLGLKRLQEQREAERTAAALANLPAPSMLSPTRGVNLDLGTAEQVADYERYLSEQDAAAAACEMSARADEAGEEVLPSSFGASNEATKPMDFTSAYGDDEFSRRPLEVYRDSDGRRYSRW